MKISISHSSQHVGKEVVIQGWVYNTRSSGKIVFLQLRDGSGFIQAIVASQAVAPEVFEAAQRATIESSVEITGTVSKHPKKEEYELQVSGVKLLGTSEEYPIGKKEHGPEFLFDNRDLYLRSQTPWAVLRIRDRVFFSIEQFFHEEGFVRFDTPIIQPTSCEDTTQLFTVDYYDEPNYLSQSGQLYSEAGIMGFGKVYDFGPVFRAEKSKTRHHLSELWMMDAEMAFHDQTMNMDVQERMVKRIVGDVLKYCAQELAILGRDTTILQRLVNEPFVHLKHHEAKRILKEEGLVSGVESYDDTYWQDDMSTEEEIALGNKYQLPVFIEDYPAAIKSFYMKKYTDEHGVLRARCADLIAPEEGREIIGGSQREESYDALKKEIVDRNYPLEEYEWYLNTRKYGTVTHSGFGIGLERTVRWLTGVHHIRETIAFPRTLNRSRP
ncbi:MAG: asparagine--tRNA ligase [Candidatus Kerfeldbacteria bacterium]|nr:asparagine--tRNA ligase [Candidatus Kerfeldbacteria bacterium]